MRRLLLVLLAFVAVTVAMAQAPEQFKYQAVLRDASGNIVASAAKTVTVELLSGSAAGAVVYKETHNITTTAQGIINLNIGAGGAPTSGSFATINWGAAAYWAKVSIGADVISSAQLLSVPYALYAKNSGSSSAGTGGTSNYIQLSMNAFQTGLSDGNEINFNTVKVSNGMTATGNGINLKAGVTYRLETALNYDGGSTNNYLGYAIITSSAVRLQTAYVASTSCTDNYAFNPVANVIYTPTVDETVYVKIVDQHAGGTARIRPDLGTYFIATEMSVSAASTSGGGTPVGTGGNANYIKLSMNATQNSVVIGNDIVFNTVASSNGITKTGNGVNLKAGKTYRLEAQINIQGSTDVHKHVGYQFNNGATNFGAGAYTKEVSSTIGYGMKAGLLEFYTPTTDETVTVKILDNGGGYNGYIENAWNTYFIATEMTSGTSGGGSATIQVVTQAERDALTSATGLMVYNTTTNKLNIYNGTSWVTTDGASAATVVPVVGAAYQGGVIAYIFQAGDPGYVVGETHGLIASTADLGTANWYNGVYALIGATDNTLGGGKANTAKLAGTTIGAMCINYNGGGYTDWYLPDYLELIKLYDNRVAIGGFSATKYWSSNEFSDSFAMAVHFSSGPDGNNGRENVYRVRAIRTF